MRTKKERPNRTGIGARLQAWRKERGLSQAQAAEEYGVPQRTWADWELEDRVPDFDVASKLETATDGRVRMIDWTEVSRVLKASKDESGSDVTRAAKAAS